MHRSLTKNEGRPGSGRPRPAASDKAKAAGSSSSGGWSAVPKPRATAGPSRLNWGGAAPQAAPPAGAASAASGGAGGRIPAEQTASAAPQVASKFSDSVPLKPGQPVKRIGAMDALQAAIAKLPVSPPKPVVAKRAVPVDPASLPEGSEMWGWGYNGYGQCGADCSELQRVPVPILISGGVSVSSIAAGQFHSLCITSTGDCWGWGQGSCGQTGTGSRETNPNPVHIRGGGLGSLKARRVSAGAYHSLVVTTTGALFGFGKVYFNQPDSLEPVRVSDLSGQSILDIASGFQHWMALADTGRLYTCGGGEMGALGHGEKVKWCNPKQIDYFAQHNVRVKHVSAGSNHSAVSTEEGDVFTWGEGRFGRLGLGHEEMVWTPTRVEAFFDTQKAGGAHVDVMSGQTISNDPEDDRMFKEWPREHVAVSRVMAGGACTVVLCTVGRHARVNEEDRDEEGEGAGNVDASPAVYSWGSGCHGQLGHGDAADVWSPMRINTFDSVNVAKVSIGEDHMVALSKQQKIFTWGRGYNGRLGTSSKVQNRHEPEVLWEVEKATHISAGGGHCLALYSSVASQLSVTAVGTSAASSVAAGDGTEKCVAGVSSEFTIFARDSLGKDKKAGGELFEAKLALVSASAGIPVAAAYGLSSPSDAFVQDLGDGSYKATFQLTRAGVYELQVQHRMLQPMGGGKLIGITGSPFKVKCSYGDPTGPQCTVSGAGISACKSGDTATFTLSLRDMFGNHITSIIRNRQPPLATLTATDVAMLPAVSPASNPAGSSVPGRRLSASPKKAAASSSDSSASKVIVVGQKNGSYVCSYKPLAVGSYLLDVRLSPSQKPGVGHERLTVKGNPFSVLCIAGAHSLPHCRCHGKGLKEGKVKEQSTFTILCRDAQGNSCLFGTLPSAAAGSPGAGRRKTASPLGALRVQMSGASSQTVAVTATDASNDGSVPLTGAYCASFTPDHPGNHFIMVMVGSAHVAGSPFRFLVEADTVAEPPQPPPPPPPSSIKVLLGTEHYEWQTAGEGFNTAQVGEASEFTLTGVLKAEFDPNSSCFVTAMAAGSVIEYVEDEGLLPSLGERLVATLTAVDGSGSVVGCVQWLGGTSDLDIIEPQSCLRFKCSYVLPSSGHYDVTVGSNSSALPEILAQGSLVCKQLITEAPSPDPEPAPKILKTVTVQMNIRLQIEDLGNAGDAHYLSTVQQALELIKQAVASSANDPNLVTLHRPTTSDDNPKPQPNVDLDWDLTDFVKDGE